MADNGAFAFSKALWAAIGRNGCEQQSASPQKYIATSKDGDNKKIIFEMGSNQIK